MSENPIRFRDDLLDLTGQEETRKAAASVRALDKALAGLVTTLSTGAPAASLNLDTLYAKVKNLTVEIQSVNIAQREQRSSLSGLAGEVGTTTRAIKELEAAERGRTKLLDVAKASVAGLKGELVRLTAEYNRLDPALEADRAKMAALAAQIRTVRTESDALTKATQRSGAAVSAAVGSYAALEQENKRLIAQLKALPDGFDNTSRAAAELKAQIAANTDKLAGFDKEIRQAYRNVGNYAESIIAALTALKRQEAQLTQNKAALEAGIRAQNALIVAQKGSSEAVDKARQRLNAYQAELHETERELRNVNVQINAFQQNNTQNNTVINQLASGFGTLVGQLAATYLGYQAVSNAANKFFDANLAYSDQAADVRKTTQLTADEFERLVEQLKTLDTRSSLSELLTIAKVGGQLGVAGKDIYAFTKAFDVLNQALSDDFKGDVELIATEVGKINTVFGKQLGGSLAENLLNIGDALNQLAADGAATVPFLADVALRVGATAANAKLGLAPVLAYAAALQEVGFSEERAGTALNQIFNKLATNPKGFFAVAKLGEANLTLKEFTHLINTDAEKAFTLFLRGLNAGNPPLTKQAQLLGDLKFKGGEVINVLRTLARETDLVAERQRVATEQLGAGTSVAAEAAIKNDTLAGSWARLKNDVSNFFTSGTAADGLKWVVDYLHAFGDVGNIRLFLGLGERVKTLVNELRGIKPPPPADVQALANAKAARAEAAALGELLTAYHQLAAVQNPDARQKLELTRMTLALKDRLGESVVVVDQETGAWKLNTKAVQGIIDKRTELADNEARRLAKKLQQVQQEVDAEAGLSTAYAKEVKARQEVLDRAGVSPRARVEIARRAGNPVEAAEQQQLSANPNRAERVAAAGLDLTPAIIQAAVGLAQAQSRLDAEQVKLAKSTKERNALQRELNALGAAATPIANQQVDDTDELNESSKEREKRLKAEADAARALAQAELELAKFRLEQRAKVQERVAADPARTEEERTAAVEKAVALRVKAEEKGMQAALLNDKLNVAQRTLLREQFEAKTADLRRDASKEEIKLHKETLDALGQLDVLRLQTENDQLVRLRDNENLDAATRLAAAEELRQNLVRIAEEQYQAEVRAAEGAADKIKVAAEKRRKAEQDAGQGSPGLGTAFKITDAGKVDTSANLRLEQALAASVGNRLKIEAQYQKERQRLEDEHDNAVLELLRKDPDRQQEAADKELDILRKKNARKLEEEKAFEQARQQIISESFAAADTIAASFFQIGSDRRNYELEHLSAQRDNDLKLAGDNTKAKEKIEKDYADRQARIKRKQAQADKTAALFEIALRTAQAVMSVNSTGGGTYFADFGITAAILTGLVIAQGAAQAAVVASRPLPAYFKGARNLPTDQLAWVGEMGREIVAAPTGPGGEKQYQLTPDRPTLAYLPKGSDVFTAAETRRMLEGWDRQQEAGATAAGIASMRGSVGRIRDNERQREAAGFRTLAQAYLSGTQALQRTIRDKHETHISGDLREGIVVTTRQGDNFTAYLHGRLHR